MLVPAFPPGPKLWAVSAPTAPYIADIAARRVPAEVTREAIHPEDLPAVARAAEEFPVADTAAAVQEEEVLVAAEVAGTLVVAEEVASAEEAAALVEAVVEAAAATETQL
jgi:hypothetical protein